MTHWVIFLFGGGIIDVLGHLENQPHFVFPRVEKQQLLSVGLRPSQQEEGKCGYRPPQPRAAVRAKRAPDLRGPFQWTILCSLFLPEGHVGGCQRRARQQACWPRGRPVSEQGSRRCHRKRPWRTAVVPAAPPLFPGETQPLRRPELSFSTHTGPSSPAPHPNTLLTPLRAPSRAEGGSLQQADSRPSHVCTAEGPCLSERTPRGSLGDADGVRKSGSKDRWWEAWISHSSGKGSRAVAAQTLSPVSSLGHHEALWCPAGDPASALPEMGHP